MDRTERAYMAGIIDGEGCIYVNKRKPTGRRVTPGYGVKVCISITDRGLVDWMAAHAGLQSIHHVANPGPNRKPKWYCAWNNSMAELLLNQVREFLVIKTRQADLGLELLAHMRTTPLEKNALNMMAPVSQENISYRESIKIKIGALNKRGRV
jgi:hypothetical protein